VKLVAAEPERLVVRLELQASPTALNVLAAAKVGRVS